MDKLTKEQAAALAAPFDPDDVDFRVVDGNTGTIAAYVDVRVVDRRLNDVLGPDGWDFDWQPLIVGVGQPRKKGGEPPVHDVIWVAKGVITINGISKAEVGDGDANETTKATVSDARKRAAVPWGVGAYLYQLERMTARVQGQTIPPEEVARLRNLLPRPVGYVAARPVAPAPESAARPAPSPQLQAAVAAWRKAMAERGITDKAEQDAWAKAHSRGRGLATLTVQDWDVLMATALALPGTDGPTRDWQRPDAAQEAP